MNENGAGGLTVELGKRTCHPRSLGAAGKRREDAVERADAEGGSGNTEKRSTINFVFHQEIT
jgi:hypothetical protein